MTSYAMLMETKQTLCTSNTMAVVDVVCFKTLFDDNYDPSHVCTSMKSLIKLFGTTKKTHVSSTVTHKDELSSNFIGSLTCNMHFVKAVLSDRPLIWSSPEAINSLVIFCAL